jgi:hypothetical protein
MAATATLNDALKTALNTNMNNRTELAPINNAAGAVVLGPTRSIHVPLWQNGANQYTRDSCITITTLLNQWNVYTRDHTVGAGGILSGYNAAGGALKNISPYLFITIFGGIDRALNVFTGLDADIGLAAAAAVPGIISPPIQPYLQAMIAALTAIRGAQNPPLPAYAPAPPAPPQDLTDGWSYILNNIVSFHPDAEKTAAANEVYDPPGGGGAAMPAISGGRVCIPPSDLIRYAFGLLWRIKTVLGDNWPDTHRQMTTGGKKSSRFTHRKKQYSQRRYKK